MKHPNWLTPEVRQKMLAEFRLSLGYVEAGIAGDPLSPHCEHMLIRYMILKRAIEDLQADQ